MIKRARALLVAAHVCGAFACTASRPATDSIAGFVPLDDSTAFIARPYVQLGAAPAPGALTLLWHAPASAAQWQVEFRRGGRWTSASAPAARPVAVPGLPPHTIYSAELTDLTPSAPVAYRVLRDNTPVFAAIATAPKAPRTPSRAVVLGDGGAGSPAQARVAYQTYRERPDLVAITGDIVYGSGRMSEYHQRFFPYYNARTADSAAGAPLMRSTVFVAAPGNHDLLRGVPLEHMSDAFGYFAYWDHPQNGPLTTVGAPYTPTFVGGEDSVRALLAALGEGYPRAANYSFDYGDAHWLILDSNPYVDWAAPELRDWLEADLRAAQDRRWRFVVLHAPGVHSSTINDGQRQVQMRLVSDLFERYDVAVVFGGHYHNYQRSRPVRFALDSAAWRAQPPRSAVHGEFGQDGSTVVPGRFTIDSAFDGETRTRPNGVIHIVTGAGGAGLYEAEKTNRPEHWQPFTARFIADVHSFTVLEVERDRLVLRQVSDRGVELDRIVVTRGR